MSAWKNHLAIKRIYKVFKRNKSSVFSEDIDALKQINSFIDNSTERSAVDNILFTKLLCAMLRYHVWYYSDIKMAIRKVSSDLNLSMDAQVMMLAKTLNDVDVSAFLEKTDLKNVSAHQKEILEKLDGNWKEENVRKSLYRTSNDLITEISHYK